MPAPVLTKADFYSRFDAGEFGNHGPMWETWGEYRRSRYPGLIAIRTRTRGGPCHYDLSFWDAFDKRADLIEGCGYCADDLHYSAMCPQDTVLIQGEVCREPDLRLYFTRSRLPMREALAKAGEHAHGLKAKMILDRAMNSRSREWLDYLLGTYDGHVVEFSTFSRCWGVLPGHNTVIWEVRRY
jgi:hypothetical protein